MLVSEFGVNENVPQLMTFREAMIQAYLEIGVSREEAELIAKAANCFIPDAAAFTQRPVKPGHERQFMQELKRINRLMDANPEAVQAVLDREMAKRSKWN